MWHELFGALILGLATFGVVTNIGALALLTQRQLRSRRGSNGSSSSTFGVFHSLLRMLSAFDLIVVICGALSYGLPNVADAYTAEVLPSISPILIPTVHVALMASVYVTVLISLERYVRICYLCQLRDSVLVSERNIRYFKLAIVLFPIVFYLPKFFEVRWHSSYLTYNATHSCQDVVMRSLASSAENSSVADAFFGILHGVDDNNSTEGTFTEVIDVVIEDNSEDHYDWLDAAMLQSCVKRMTSMHYDNASLAQVVVRHSRKYIELTPTALRRSPTYYFYYCVLASCLVSMILPLAALLFLNISTARVLNKMVKDEEDEFFAQNDSSNGSKRPSHQGFKYHLRRLTTATLVTSNVEDAEDPDLDHSSSVISDQTNKNGDVLALAKLDEEKGVKSDGVSTCETSIVQLAGITTEYKSHGENAGETGKECNLVGRNGEAKVDNVLRKKSISRAVTQSPTARLTETPAVTLTAATSCGRLSPLVPTTPNTGRSGPLDVPLSGATLSPCDAEREAFIASRIARNKSPTRQQNGKVVGTFGAARLNSCASPSSVNLRAASPSARAAGGMDGASKAHRRRERRLARISISIVWLFVVCHIWKLIPTAYEALHSDDGLNVDSWPFWLIIIEHVSHTLITFNSAVNFLIYVLK